MRAITLFSILVLTAGCSTFQQVAAGVGSATAGAFLAHVASADVQYNPSTGVWTGEVIFKDGRLQKVYAPMETRAVAEICNDTPATKAIDSCTKTVEREIIDYKALVNTGGGLRSISGPIPISERSIARNVARAAKQSKEEEKEAYRNAKEIHREEMRRLDTIIHASSQTTLGHMRRAVVGTPCALPLNTSTSTSTSTAPIVDSVANVQTNPPVTLPGPDPNTLPESGTMKGISNLEARVTALENNQKSDHDVLQAMRSDIAKILDRLPEKKP